MVLLVAVLASYVSKLCWWLCLQPCQCLCQRAVLGSCLAAVLVAVLVSVGLFLMEIVESFRFLQVFSFSYAEAPHPSSVLPSLPSLLPHVLRPFFQFNTIYTG